MFIIDYLQNSTIFLLTIGVFCLLVGSFLNVVIVRLPHHVFPNSTHSIPSFWEPRSRCLTCQTPIRIFDNIPLLSFCWLRGRCRHCRSPISLRYPLVELTTCFFSILVAASIGAHISIVPALLFTWGLITLAFIDYEHLILPDHITLPFIILGLCVNFFDIFCSFQSAVMGAFLGYFVLWLVYHAHKFITQKEGMGYGDFKLLSMIGAWLGFECLPFIILMASLLGSVIGISLIVFKKKNKDFPLPFGPCLALGGMMTFLLRKPLFHLIGITL